MNLKDLLRMSLQADPKGMIFKHLVEDKNNSPGDDSIKPTTSPIEMLPYTAALDPAITEAADVVGSAGSKALSSLAQSKAMQKLMGYEAPSLAGQIFDATNPSHLGAISKTLEDLLPHSADMSEDVNNFQVLKQLLKEEPNNTQLLSSPEMLQAYSKSGLLNPTQLPNKFSVLTAENPGAVPASPAANASAMQSLYSDLNKQNIPFQKISGNYGSTPESSVLIPHSDSVNEQVLNDIAQKYQQQSIVHKLDDQNVLQYLNGPQAGQYFKGQGLSTDSGLASDYSQLPSGQKFQLNFDFNKPQQIAQPIDLKSILGLTDDAAASLSPDDNSKFPILKRSLK